VRRAFVASLLLMLEGSAALAQAPWLEPIAAPWPLADLALSRRADGTISLIAYPNPITVQSDTSETFLSFTIAPQLLRAWLPRARQFLDSVLLGPRDLLDEAAGLGLPTNDGTGRVTFAHDPRGRPTSRFLLVLAPPAPRHGWTVRGSGDIARRFLDALDSALVDEPPADTPNGDSLAPPTCPIEPPRMTTPPKLTSPTGKRLGGRVVTEFVVDTAGVPDPVTVRVLLSSGPVYTSELQRHFAELRYSPAVCDGQPVRLLVQQGFSWRIEHR
jgi:hypothetical protein